MNIENLNLENLIPVGFIGLAVIFILFRQLSVKRRREGIRQLSSQIGFTFSEELPAEIKQQLDQFSHFTTGRSKKYVNVLSRRDSDGDCFIFDYSYVSSSGKNSSTHFSTVVVFRNERKVLPAFAIRRETIFDRIGSLIGFKDINLPEAPAFSEKFLLKGNDEEEIRRLFTPTIIRHFEANPNLNIEAQGALFVATKGMGYCKIEALRSLYEEAGSMYRLFR